MSEIAERRAATRRPFVLLYRPGRDNFCPGCGQMHWYIGRAAAECAVCTTVLPLADMALRETAYEPDLRARAA